MNYFIDIITTVGVLLLIVALLLRWDGYYRCNLLETKLGAILSLISAPMLLLNLFDHSIIWVVWKKLLLIFIVIYTIYSSIHFLMSYTKIQDIKYSSFKPRKK